MTCHGRYPPSEPRLAKLKAYLVTVTVLPSAAELAMLLGVAISTAQKDLRLLESRGLVLPPKGPRYPPKGAVQCSVIPSRQQGQSGWMVFIKGNIIHPARPVRFRHWCADIEEALIIQRAVRAGQSIENAITELMK